MMADFLAHLAGQALGVRPDIRPDTASVFGPVVVIDTNPRPSLESEESLIAAPVTPHNALRGTEHQPSEAQPEVKQLAPAANMKIAPRPTGPVLTPPHQRQRARESVLDEEDITPLPKLPKAQSLDAHNSEAQSFQGKREPSPRRIQSTAPAVAMAISPQTRVAASTVVPRTETTTRMEAPAPAMHVTIGRVEVHAIAPQPVPIQRLPEKITTSNQSLDEYLKERNRGRR